VKDTTVECCFRVYVMRERGILTYVCVILLAFGGAGASVGGIDESAAPVVQSWPAEAQLQQGFGGPATD
jgi:hypothetical protein